MAALDFAGLAGDALVDLAGEALRPAFAGVPSARDFAMAQSIECDNCIFGETRNAEV